MTTQNKLRSFYFKQSFQKNLILSQKLCLYGLKSSTKIVENRIFRSNFCCSNYVHEPSTKFGRHSFGRPLTDFAVIIAAKNYVWWVQNCCHILGDPTKILIRGFQTRGRRVFKEGSRISPMSGNVWIAGFLWPRNYPNRAYLTWFSNFFKFWPLPSLQRFRILPRVPPVWS